MCQKGGRFGLQIEAKFKNLEDIVNTGCVYQSYTG